MMDPNIKDALKNVRERISSIKNLMPDNKNIPKLLAVSKKQSIEKIKNALDCGQIEFGENYAQELETKVQALKGTPARWVFIGRLQSNKIKKIVKYADEIQTVSSLKQASLIARHAKEFEKTPFPIFILLNAGNEEQKDGVLHKDLPLLASEIQDKLPELELQGIMSIPPKEISSSSSKDNIPELYHKLRLEALNVGKGKLSLGMSRDLEAALLAGSDQVRVGSDIFGERIK